MQLTTMHCLKNAIIVLVWKHFGPHFFYCTNILWGSKGKLVNAFHAIALFLHPLKIPENLLFCDCFMWHKKETSGIKWLKRNKASISSLEISCVFFCVLVWFFSAKMTPLKMPLYITIVIFHLMFVYWWMIIWIKSFLF